MKFFRTAFLVVTMLAFLLTAGAFAGMPTCIDYVMSDGTNFWIIVGNSTNILFSSTNIVRACCAATNEGPLAQFSVVSNAVPVVGDMLRHDGTRWVPTSGYVDRSAGWAVDYTNGNFTMDGNWYDLNIYTNSQGTTVIPSDIKAVKLVVSITDDTVGAVFKVKGKGKNGQGVYSVSLAGVIKSEEVICAVDASGNIQYKGDAVLNNATFTGLSVAGAWY